MDKFIIISISVRLRRLKAIFLLAHLLKFISYGHCCGILCATTLKSAAYDACFPEITNWIRILQPYWLRCLHWQPIRWQNFNPASSPENKHAAGLRIKSHNAE